MINSMDNNPYEPPSSRWKGSTPSIRKIKRSTAIYLAANSVCGLVYSIAVVRIKQQAAIEERLPDAGDSLNFLLTGAPILAFVVVYSVAWGIRSAVTLLKSQYEGIKALAITLIGWAALILMLRALD